MPKLQSILSLSFLLVAFASCISTLPKTKYLGAAINVTALNNDQKYRQLVVTHFSTLTAENEMKWDYLEKEQGKYNTTAADQLYKFILEKNKWLRFHTVLAQNQNPKWIQGLSKPQMIDAAYAHLEFIFKRYHARMVSIDVCNEILDGAAFRQTIWLTTWGETFVEDIYRKARELANKYNPAIKLCINDYGIESIGPKSDFMLRLAKRLKDLKLLDQVGFQAHLEVGKFPADFRENLLRFTQAGLFVALTELDIRINLTQRTAEQIQNDRKQQTLDFQKAFEVCSEVEKCLGVTLWGVADPYSWIPKNAETRGAGEALLFDSDLNPKPAFAVLQAKSSRRKRC